MEQKMKQINLSVALLFIGISNITFAQTEPVKVSLPIEPVNSAKILAEVAEQTENVSNKLKVARDLQSEKENNAFTVDPSTFLSAALGKDEGKYTASNGERFDINGNKIEEEPKDMGDFIANVKNKYSPQQKVTLLPGGNVILPVSGGLGNTIKTNFHSVAVKTSSSDAVIDIEKGYIVVTPKGTQPIDLKIYEEGVLNTMVNITLVPFNVPPAMIDMKVKMNAELKNQVKDYRTDISNKLQLAQEKAVHAQDKYTDEHQARIREILTPVAKGDIPRGFTLSEVKNYDGVSPCQLSIPHTIGQQLVGAREIVDVVLVKNTWNDVYPIQEEFCQRDGVISVAVYDNAILQPGETTEIYILRDKLYEQRKKQLRTRPRLSADMFRSDK